MRNLKTPLFVSVGIPTGRNSNGAVFLLFFTIFTPLFSQTEMNIKQSCNFTAADTSGTLYTYDASKEALVIIDSIMYAISLPQNFTVKAADCANALATSEGKQRYILYSTTFLERFKKDAKTRWAAYCVLAHEIGHHLSNHDLEETTPSHPESLRDGAVRRRFELEADRFAGGVLFKMGASLENAQAGINTFSDETASKTHPPKQARLEAISVGWKQAQEFADKAVESEEPLEEVADEKKMFQRAVLEKDAERAIAILDSVIELNGNFIDAYLERGKREKDKEDFRRNFNYALEDFNTYIKTRAKNPIAYFERGYAYLMLDKNKEAVADFDRAIKIKPDYAEAYAHRAYAKHELELWDGAINDLNLAVKYKPDYAEAYYWHGNYLYGWGKYTEAIEQLGKALKADPAYFEALSLRAAAKQFSNQFAEAVADFNLLESKQGKDFNSFYNRAQCYQALNKHKEAIAEWDKVLEKNGESSDALMFRGISKWVLGKKTEAQADFDKVMSITNSGYVYQGKIGCLLVQNAFYKEALVWLDKTLAEKPDLEIAQKCKAEALKKLKN